MFERAASLLDELLALPASERASALSRMSIDEPLRREVESLLEHDEQDSFLEQGAPGLHAVEATGSHPDQIGGYPIVRVLGAGGMGIVYEVVQTTVGRKAALKVMHDAYADERSRLRMQLEIEVLGRLDHPGIAHIFEAGVDDSGHRPRPFFLMEFVDGGPIDQWVRSERLDMMATVDLFLRVCDAVQHAHSNGVIHRDLKPENIFVDPNGTPRVLDFGIARPVRNDGSLEPATLTGAAMLGTLAYMSPEQCASDRSSVDVRSDVYSLGVVLFELLSGHRPIETRGLSIVQAARCICEEKPARPTFNRHSLPADLEGILFKALEKAPDRRYATVAALADDLRRWQQRLPVEARTFSPWRNVHAWIVRHPVWSTTALCGLIGACSLALTMLSVWWLGWRPNGIVSRKDQKIVQLVSSAGRTLKEWDGVGLAAYIQHPDHDIAVLSFDRGNRLQGFRADAPDEPLWSIADLGLSHPALDLLSPTVPNRNVFQVADFFPAREGPEILFVERLSPESPCVIRILSPLGELLFEAWHNGSVTGAHWFPSEGRLICCGYLSTPTWSDRGVDLRNHPWPVVVFAIDLIEGLIVNDEFLAEEDRVLDFVAWYRWAGPVPALRRSQRIRPVLLSEELDGVWTGKLHLTAFHDDNHLSHLSSPEYVGLYLQPDGDVYFRLTSDEYEAAAARGEYAQADAWRLLDLAELPPVLPERE